MRLPSLDSKTRKFEQKIIILKLVFLFASIKNGTFVESKYIRIKGVEYSKWKGGGGGAGERSGGKFFWSVTKVRSGYLKKILAGMLTRLVVCDYILMLG